MDASKIAAHWEALAGALDAQEVYGERHRPQYHFSPVVGWVNDPNGLVYFEREYHLFYQHTHERLRDGPNWGHAVSADLLHWAPLPVALEPDDLGVIYSGSAVVDRDDTSGFFGGGAGLLLAFSPLLRGGMFLQGVHVTPHW